LVFGLAKKSATAALASARMLRLTELKLPLDHSGSALRDAVLTTPGIPSEDLLSAIARRGYGARRRSSIHLVYAVDVHVQIT
jgi:hypothetical protein